MKNSVVVKVDWKSRLLLLGSLLLLLLSLWNWNESRSSFYSTTFLMDRAEKRDRDRRSSRERCNSLINSLVAQLAFSSSSLLHKRGGCAAFSVPNSNRTQREAALMVALALLFFFFFSSSIKIFVSATFFTPCQLFGQNFCLWLLLQQLSSASVS